MISQYRGIAPKGQLELLKILGDKFAGRSILNVNSTRAGGGVAELLHRIMPILTSMGIDAHWEVIEGDDRFFDITKKIHNALQGNLESFTDDMWDHHFEINCRNAENIDLEADFVFIHDPQPAPLVRFRKRGHWIWRCHIDMSTPQQDVAGRIMDYARQYEAAVFSVAKFAMLLPIPEFIVLPSIDPLSDKNRELTPAEIEETASKFNIPPDRPMVLQVSRFDRFKDPVGVIKAYRMIKKYNDCILVLAGSPARDDPEGEAVLAEVQNFADGDPDIRILLLPPFSDKEINALQRLATVIFQKSLREGFGLTVSEAMWKGKPVIGGAVGGIPHQIVHGVNGFLVYSEEGGAFRARQYLNNDEMLKRMGEAAREHVRNNFLITRQVGDYLSICLGAENAGKTVMEIG
ncbi:MAG: glycosyltransferase [Nitrospiraceae bacterium]|nr:glycosyltransferase [Nitrospiraceae bacterium]